MAQHLSHEEIELLSKYQLRGKRLPQALSHIEACAECREKVKSPTRAEIIERLLPDEKESAEAEAAAKKDRDSKSPENAAVPRPAKAI